MFVTISAEITKFALSLGKETTLLVEVVELAVSLRHGRQLSSQEENIPNQSPRANASSVVRCGLSTQTGVFELFRSNGAKVNDDHRLWAGPER